jgi:hypothetical protein
MTHEPIVARIPGLTKWTGFTFQNTNIINYEILKSMCPVLMSAD